VLELLTVEINIFFLGGGAPSCTAGTIMHSLTTSCAAWPLAIQHYRSPRCNPPRTPPRPGHPDCPQFEFNVTSAEKPHIQNDVVTLHRRSAPSVIAPACGILGLRYHVDDVLTHCCARMCKRMGEGAAPSPSLAGPALYFARSRAHEPCAGSIQTS
jgi:hypothetical protein